ncbi:MAG: DNA-binding protein [Eubacteriales bacterium]
MSNTKFITSAEMATELGISKSYAYKLVRQLNEELESRGFFTLSGKVSRTFFEEKFYGVGGEV